MVPLDQDNPECLSVKDETLAAFLETRRYATIKGASINLSFMSSLTYNGAKSMLMAAFESV